MSSELNRMISTEQAARMLDITQNAMKMRAYRGVIKATKRGGRYWFKISDLIDEIDSSDDDRPIDYSTPGPDSDFISLFEAAELLQMPTQTLWARIKSRLKPIPVGRVDGRWKYRRSDVMGARKKLDAQGKYLDPLKPKVQPTPSRKDERYGIRFETIIAICPTCHEPHDEFVVRGSSKWIYCSKHACYRNAPTARYAPNNVNLPSMIEY